MDERRIDRVPIGELHRRNVTQNPLFSPWSWSNRKGITKFRSGARSVRVTRWFDSFFFLFFRVLLFSIARWKILSRLSIHCSNIFSKNGTILFPLLLLIIIPDCSSSERIHLWIRKKKKGKRKEEKKLRNENTRQSYPSRCTNESS